MRQPGGHVRPRWSGSVQSAVFRGDELAGEHGHGPAPFNPDLVHITPPDEHAYLQAVFPAGTGTVSGLWVPITLSRSLTSCFTSG